MGQSTVYLYPGTKAQLECHLGILGGFYYAMICKCCLSLRISRQKSWLVWLVVFVLSLNDLLDSEVI